MVVFAVALTALASGLVAQDPVTVSVAVGGDPAPGASVTLTATVTTSDGSTFQSMTWSQTGGIPVTLANTTSPTVTVTLPSRAAFRSHLIEILEEAPTATGPLPGNQPTPDPFHGGLQHRFQVVGINPLAEEHAGAINLKMAIVTTSGTYNKSYALHASLPWPWSTGNRNVAIKTPVVLHGKTQDTYNWALTVPTGSTATLVDATTRNPEFTPDVAGMYTVTVTDTAAGAPVTIDIYAGTWVGVIVGQDSNGRPIADSFCTSCHSGSNDQFTPWAKSGHAEIFKDNVNNPNGHYSTNCVVCHTQGYDLTVANDGIDDQDDWQALVDSGKLTHGAVTNWTDILTQFPKSARRANIQCENCHGPNLGPGHARGDGARQSVSSDICATCHGEPPRHGRFQQWQLSGHANYETAIAEGMSAGCAKCHSGQGFVKWAKQGFTGSITVDWTEDEIHPITCAACHEPHDVGTTSGSASTNSTVRLIGTTPKLDAGFAVEDAGKAATCMMCHNSRRGLKNDGNFGSDLSRATHLGPQTDVLMGQNMYFAEVGKPGFHSKIEDSCVTCHMEETDPPAGLSYNLGGTNHVFYASKTICANCHTNITAESVQEPMHHKLEEMKHGIETGIADLMRTLLLTGNKIDIGGTVVDDATDIASVEFIESHGRQGVNVTLTDGNVIHDIAMNSVQVVNPAGGKAELYSFADPALPKAGWNYFMLHSDGSLGVHNPTFAISAVDVTMHALEESNATYETTLVGGGPGNGVGAVSCTSSYVYWAEIAGRILGGSGSDWRTDLVARNLTGTTANVTFYLHEANGQLTGTGTVAGKTQKVFEDVVGSMGGTNNIGSLEICSDQPLLVLSRIFNQAAQGTFGQSFDGKLAIEGLMKGETASLIGMRQATGLYRTNLSVTNTGTAAAEVSVTLYDAAGTALHTYTIPVAAGQVVQDTAPFANRANAPDVGWGYATVTVVNGSHIHASASMVDMTTNDPTTIPAKR